METKITVLIDKVEYIIEARGSENAVDTLHKKIEKLLIRDIRRNVRQEDLDCENIGQNVENADL